MELANSRVEKNVNISQEKMGSRVVQVEKIHVSSEMIKKTMCQVKFPE
jgi:DNA anti-recombination protein RmuC